MIRKVWEILPKPGESLKSTKKCKNLIRTEFLTAGTAELEGREMTVIV